MKDDELQRWADAFRDEFRPPADLRARVDRRIAVDDLDRWSKAFRDQYAPPPGLREHISRALEREAPTQPPRPRWVAGFLGGEQIHEQLFLSDSGPPHGQRDDPKIGLLAFCRGKLNLPLLSASSLR